MTKPGIAGKLLVAAISTAVFSAAAYLVWPYLERESEMVEVVDNTEALQALATDRAKQDAAAGSSAADLDVAGVDDPRPIVREPLTRVTASLFFPALRRNESCEFNEFEYIRRVPNYERWIKFAEHPAGGFSMQSNSLGFRGDEEVAEVQPDLRILLTGDSHIDGICAHEESCASDLERRLVRSNPQRSVEVINAGAGSHCLFNYLGTFERFHDLQPDLYVVVVYGGNDFSTTVLMDRHFRRSGPFKTKPNAIEVQERASAVQSLMPQEFSQDLYFANNPADVERVIEVCSAISLELARQCAARGVDLLFVYLPPPTVGQPQFFQAERDLLLSDARTEGPLPKSSETIADGWTAFLADRGIACIDLRESFRESDECYYWRTDHHLNVAGHRFLGETLFEYLGDRYAR